MLGIYRDVTGVELVIDPQTDVMKDRITIRGRGIMTASEMLIAIEQALLDQAAISISRLEGNRVLVKSVEN